jgi:ABC-type methionine transport system ATPase subunit
MRDRLRLTFEKDKVAEPVVCLMAKQFEVTFSIRRANVETDAGWMDLELQGDDAEIERAIAGWNNPACASRLRAATF